MKNIPAFPNNFTIEKYQGLTIRDYFAAKAMQALLREYPFHLVHSPANEVACDAYIVADKMLEARKDE